jgi:hypothetical protein
MEVSFGLNMKWIIQRTGLSRGIFPAFNVVNFFAIQSEWRFVSADSVRIEKQNTYTSVMATLLPNSSVSRQKLKGHRVFVFSHDHPLPAHIHFGKRRRFSSWDIQQLKCTDPDNFSTSELAVQRSLLIQYAEEILRSWHEHWHNQNTH